MTAKPAIYRRFPVKPNGAGATFSWTRDPNRPLANRYEPDKGMRGGRRNDPITWCMWAYHAALGDTVTLHTAVLGRNRTYVLKATPAEGREFLERHAHSQGFNMLRGTARQWLSALDKYERANP